MPAMNDQDVTFPEDDRAEKYFEQCDRARDERKDRELDAALAASEASRRIPVRESTLPANLPPLPPVPEGYDRWVYRGKGWKPGENRYYAAAHVDETDEWHIPFILSRPAGSERYHYLEAVRDEPDHRHPTDPNVRFGVVLKPAPAPDCSDTPLTDKAAFTLAYDEENVGEITDASFARQLERRNAEMAEDCASWEQVARMNERTAHAASRRADLAEAELAGLKAEREELAKAIVAKLYDCSTLRHALFTPPEFSRLINQLVREALADAQRGKEGK